MESEVCLYTDVDSGNFLSGCSVNMIQIAVWSNLFFGSMWKLCT